MFGIFLHKPYSCSPLAVGLVLQMLQVGARGAKGARGARGGTEDAYDDRVSPFGESNC